MKDEKLIDQMREAVMKLKFHNDGGIVQAYEGPAVNDACLLSLANMSKQYFIKQACEAIIENISNTFESDYIKGFDDGLRGAIQTIKEQIK